MVKVMRAFGSTGTSSFIITTGPEFPAPGDTQMVVRTLWFDRDIDGSWLVWAADPVDGGPIPSPAGAIAVRDATVGAFLEALGQLLADPGRFEHEPRFDGTLRWVHSMARAKRKQTRPMMSLLDDVSTGLLSWERTGMLFHDP